ncbi:hypothetical protein M885DRAFT_623497 [Pelagophyceae sp. CCMP2097]|nr:hypothetical protein M885DRAFT_623497 [Pelagophyceae sp. CCMP2097]
MWTTINKDAAVAAAPRGESLELKEHRLRLRYDEARASGDAAAFAGLLQELGWKRRKDEAACLPALRLLALRAYGDVLDKTGDAKGALEADAHALELAPDDVGLWLRVLRLASVECGDAAAGRRRARLAIEANERVIALRAARFDDPRASEAHVLRRATLVDRAVRAAAGAPRPRPSSATEVVTASVARNSWRAVGRALLRAFDRVRARATANDDSASFRTLDARVALRLAAKRPRRRPPGAAAACDGAEQRLAVEGAAAASKAAAKAPGGGIAGETACLALLGDGGAAMAVDGGDAAVDGGEAMIDSGAAGASSAASRRTSARQQRRHASEAGPEAGALASTLADRVRLDLATDLPELFALLVDGANGAARPATDAVGDAAVGEGRAECHPDWLRPPGGPTARPPRAAEASRRRRRSDDAPPSAARRRRGDAHGGPQSTATDDSAIEDVAIDDVAMLETVEAPSDSVDVDDDDDASSSEDDAGDDADGDDGAAAFILRFSGHGADDPRGSAAGIDIDGAAVDGAPSSVVELLRCFLDEVARGATAGDARRRLVRPALWAARPDGGGLGGIMLRAALIVEAHGGARLARPAGVFVAELAWAASDLADFARRLVALEAQRIVSILARQAEFDEDPILAARLAWVRALDRERKLDVDGALDSLDACEAALAATDTRATSGAAAAPVSAADDVALDVPHLGEAYARISPPALRARRGRLAARAAQRDAAAQLVELAASAASAVEGRDAVAPETAPGGDDDQVSRFDDARVARLWRHLEARFVEPGDGDASGFRLAALRDVDALVADVVRAGASARADGRGAPKASTDGALASAYDRSGLGVLATTCSEHYERADLALQLVVAAIEAVLRRPPGDLLATLPLEQKDARAAAVDFDAGAVVEYLYGLLARVLAGRNVADCVAALGPALVALVARGARVASRRTSGALLDVVAGVSRDVDGALGGGGAAGAALFKALFGAVRDAAATLRASEAAGAQLRGVCDFCAKVLRKLADGAVAPAAGAVAPAATQRLPLCDALAAALDIMMVVVGDDASCVRPPDAAVGPGAADGKGMDQERRELSALAASTVAEMVEEALFTAPSGGLDVDYRLLCYSGVVHELHAHLAAHGCCDAADAVFLRRRVALFDRVAAAAECDADGYLPLRRPLPGDAERVVSQCYCCLVGTRVAASDADHVPPAAAAARLRAWSPAAAERFVLFVAPLVLDKRPAATVAVVGRRDMLATLQLAAAAHPGLARSLAEDDVAPDAIGGGSNGGETPASPEAMDGFAAPLTAARGASVPADEARRLVDGYALSKASGDGATDDVEKFVDAVCRHSSAADDTVAAQTASARRFLAAMTVSKLGGSTGLAGGAGAAAAAADAEASNTTSVLTAREHVDEVARLEAFAWQRRAVYENRRDAHHWAGLARLAEALATPLLRLCPLLEPRTAAGAEAGVAAPAALRGRSLALYVSTPFGDAVALRAAAVALQRDDADCEWRAFDEFSDEWHASLAVAFAAARRTVARRCWAVCAALASRGGSDDALRLCGKAHAAAATLAYDALRELAAAGAEPAGRRLLHRAATRAFKLSCKAAPREPFAHLMLGKLAWRDGARNFGERAAAALELYALALAQCAMAATATRCADVDVVYRLHASRLKVLCTADADDVASLQRICLVSKHAFHADRRGRSYDASTAPRGAFIEQFDDCLDALRACRRQAPHHGRSAHAAARALRHRYAALGDHAALLQAKRAAEPLFDKKRCQIVAVWLPSPSTAQESRLYTSSGSLDLLDSSRLKYDQTRIKYLALYLDVLVDTTDVQRLGALSAQIAASKERSAAMRAMLRLVLRARGRATEDIILSYVVPCAGKATNGATAAVTDAATDAAATDAAAGAGPPPRDAAAADPRDAAPQVPPPPPPPPPALALALQLSLDARGAQRRGLLPDADAAAAAVSDADAVFFVAARKFVDGCTADTTREEAKASALRQWPHLLEDCRPKSHGASKRRRPKGAAEAAPAPQAGDAPAAAPATAAAPSDAAAAGPGDATVAAGPPASKRRRQSPEMAAAARRVRFTAPPTEAPNPLEPPNPDPAVLAHDLPPLVPAHDVRNCAPADADARDASPAAAPTADAALDPAASASVDGPSDASS